MPGVVAVVRDGSFVGVVGRARGAGDARRRACCAPRARWARARDAAGPRRARALAARAARRGVPRHRRDAVGPGARSPTRRSPGRHRGGLHAPLPDARLDRTVRRDGAVAGRRALEVWTHSQGVYVLREALAAALALRPAADPRPPRRGPRLLRPQRRRRRRVRRRAARDGGARARGAAQVVARGRAPVGALRAAGPRRAAGAASTATAGSPTGATTSGARRTSRGRWSAGTPNLLAGAHLDPPIELRARPAPFAREGGRHPPQRDADLRPPAATHRQALRRGDAAANLVAAQPRRPCQRVRDRVVHGRARRALPASRRSSSACATSATRARARCSQAAADAAGWNGAASAESGRGTGVALARYKNSAAYAAVVVAPARRRRDRRDRARADRDRRRLRRGRRPERRDQPARGRRAAVGELDAQGAGGLRRDCGHERRLGQLPDPALQRGAAGRNRVARSSRASRSSASARRRRDRPRAAIANAVFDAIGVRLRDTPFTPARVREAALVA